MQSNYQHTFLGQDSYIVDNGEQGVWAWIGKKATPKERIEAMRNAQGFIRKKNYSPHTPVTRVIDGGEPEEFKSLFSKWRVKHETVGFGRQYSNNRGIANVERLSFDASLLHEQPKMAAQMRMIDEGAGSKKVYKVHNFELVEVPIDNQGSFFEHDCYVIEYTSSGLQEHVLVYFWLVRTPQFPGNEIRWLYLYFGYSRSIFYSRAQKLQTKTKEQQHFTRLPWMMLSMDVLFRSALFRERSHHIFSPCSEDD